MWRTIISTLSLTLVLLVCSSQACAAPPASTAASDDDARETAWDVLRGVLPADALQALAPGFGFADDANDDLPPVDKPPHRVIVRGSTLHDVPLMQLPAVNIQQLLNEDAQMAQFTKAMRFGVGRNLLAEMGNGRWIRMDGGWLWVIDVQADGALAMRLHALNMFLPEGATLIAYAADAADPAASAVGPYDDAGPFDDGDIWLPTIVSQRARVELWVPSVFAAGKDRPPAGALLVLDRLQHIYRDPLSVEANDQMDEGGIAGPPPCHNQVACYPDWADTANAVGGIGTIGENSMWCTGQLIRTEADDHTPYFLTAHHCLSTNFEARSCEVYWKYQASTCGGLPPALNTVPHSNVCSLVATGTGSDFTLLMIEGPLPVDASWASWTGVDAADGTDVVCIHHPQGKQKRISFGTKASNPTCGNLAQHIRVNWTSGVTEPGSSGSGVFRADTGELIGQLHCGSSACGNVTNDSFGAFFVTNGLISSLLDAGSDDTFEPNNTCGTAATLTAGTYSNLVVKSVDLDWYRIRVQPGKTVTVSAKFKDSWGDIDLRLYSDCGTQVDTSTGTGNVETVQWTNSGGAAKWARVRVYLFGDVRNTYKLTVSVQ